MFEEVLVGYPGLKSGTAIQEVGLVFSAAGM